MSNNRFVWDGLEELRAALRRLPHELTGEGVHIVEGATNGAEAAIKAGYPPGDLQNATSSSVSSSGFGVVGVVKNSHKLAAMFESGTQARHYITHNGVTHETGRMPPKHLFIPTMERVRRRMYDVDFRDLLTRHGLQVSGNAE